MPTHILHIDDSGTKDYAADPSDYEVGPTRYFVFGGLLSTVDEASRLAQRVQSLKRDAFGTKDVEIKSNWLRMPEEREEKYLRPYLLDVDDLTDFVDHYYELVARADVVLIAAIVDKVHMQELYKRPYYPPALAYEVLAQRVQLELGDSGSCQMVVDDMTGRNPKGNEHKRNLIRQHGRLRQHGSTLQKGMRLDALDSLRFRSSHLSDLVQLADIVSYNVLRQFREHGEAWESIGLRSLPTYEHFARLAPKFRQGPGGRIQGYGVVKVPIIERVRWAFKKRRAAP